MQTAEAVKTETCSVLFPSGFLHSGRRKFFWRKSGFAVSLAANQVRYIESIGCATCSQTVMSHGIYRLRYLQSDGCAACTIKRRSLFCCTPRETSCSGALTRSCCASSRGAKTACACARRRRRPSSTTRTLLCCPPPHARRRSPSTGQGPRSQTAASAATCCRPASCASCVRIRARCCWRSTTATPLP